MCVQSQYIEEKHYAMGMVVVGLIVEEISNVNVKCVKVTQISNVDVKCVKVTGAPNVGQGHWVKVSAKSVHREEALCKVCWL